MKRVNTKPQTPLPCKDCGKMPKIVSVDTHFAQDDSYMTTNIQIRCSTTVCNYHRHFTPKATRREAVAAWNAANKVNGRKVATP